MRKMTFRLGIAALFGSLGILGCNGDVEQAPTDGAQAGDSPQRGVVISAGRDSIAAFKGNGTPSDVYPHGDPPNAAPANDACSGEALALAAGDPPLHVEGTLVEATDDYTMACADTSIEPGNPDVVYALTITGEDPITVKISLNATGFDPAMQLRMVACETEDAADVCKNQFATSELSNVALAAGTYWLVVKSADGATGAFTLDLTATSPACGDAGLECATPANDTCSGQVVPLDTTLNSTVSVNSILLNAADDMTTWCADSVADPGNPDVVYQLDVSEEISLTILLTGANDFNPALSLRLTECGKELGGDTCFDLPSATTAEHLTMGLPAGTYWLVVDTTTPAADISVGAFTVDFTAAAPSCGDGILNSGEDCDPGISAESNDDGCWDHGTASECTWGEAPQNTNVTTCPGIGRVNVLMSADPQNPTIYAQGLHNNGSGGKTQQNDTTVDPNICGWAATGPENIYNVFPDSDGTMHARIGYDGASGIVCDSLASCGDFILYARKDQCLPIDPADPAQQIGCVDFDPGNQEILDLSFPVTASTDYWVFVDGLDSQWGVGPYYLELWLVPTP